LALFTRLYRDARSTKHKKPDTPIKIVTPNQTIVASTVICFYHKTGTYIHISHDLHTYLPS